MRTIAIVNQKGGCGKTTTAINLAAIYARRGLRTLLVDMDQQSHCAAGLGVPETRLEYSLADALLAEPVTKANLADLIWEVGRNFDLAPSTMRMAGLEAPGGGLHRLPDKDRRLAQLLDTLASRYDRCLIDCPPTVGLLTFNALRAAREVIIPVETGFFALRGAEKQWATIQRTIERLERPIACHLLVTLFDPNSNVAREILATLRRKFAGQIVPVVIHEHDSLREAASFGQPIIEYAPDSPAHHDFNQLADWLEQHESRAGVEIEVLPQRAAAPPVCPAIEPGADEAPPAPVWRGANAATLGDADRRLHAGREAAVDPISAAATAEPVDRPHGGRAAELAARVRELLMHRSEHEPAAASPSAEPAPRAAPAPIAARPARRQSAPATPGMGAVAELAEIALGTSDEQWSETAADLDLTTLEREIAAALTLDEPAREESLEAPRHAEARSGQVYGARRTSCGVLFVQPAGLGEQLFVAGDFNGWSASSTPLRLDRDLGVHHAVVSIPPGRYQYRLVVDGRWQADPNNEQLELNDYGEPNSVLVVT